MTTPYRRVGRVLKPHGTHGEVSAVTVGGLPISVLENLRVWMVPPPPSGVREFRVSAVRPGGKRLILGFDDVSSAEQAGSLAGRWLLARAADIPEDVIVREDLIGMKVHDRVRGDLGVVTDVIVTGANDVLVVDEGAFGQILIPDIPDVVDSVNDETATIHVQLLDGLIDEDER